MDSCSSHSCCWSCGVTDQERPKPTQWKAPDLCFGCHAKGVNLGSVNHDHDSPAWAEARAIEEAKAGGHTIERVTSGDFADKRKEQKAKQEKARKTIADWEARA